MREQLTADFTYAAVKKMDPRHARARPLRQRQFGTDWAAYCINWATEYQRTGDTKCWTRSGRHADTARSCGQPGQLLGAGPYDPATGKFMSAGRGGGPTNFDLLFGTVEIMSELELSIDYPKYWEAWHAYAASGDGRPLAYAAWVTKNPELSSATRLANPPARRPWRSPAFMTEFHQVNPPDVPFPLREASGQPSAGPDGNRLGALIQMLEWAGQYLP